MKKSSPQNINISQLPIDHPGAHDRVYRIRRDSIACLARAYRLRGGAIPRLIYLPTETRTWAMIASRLQLGHSTRASRVYVEAKKKLRFDMSCVPQLADVSAAVEATTRFRIEPVEGLVAPRDFLMALGERVFLSTQYLRHASRPEYTPEPDIIHELLGHAPMFMHAEFADFSERVGRAAEKATNRQLQMLERLYWFTVEFGLIREGRDIKAFGAGLLSSFGELEHAFSVTVERRPFSIEDVVRTPYDYSQMQKILFVIPSFAELLRRVEEFFEKEGI